MSGYVLFHNIDGTFSNGWEYKDGEIVGRVLSSQEAEVSGIDGEKLLLEKHEASYQVFPRLDKQPRVQTRSSGEVDGGSGTWLPEVTVVGTAPNKGNNDESDDDDDNGYTPITVPGGGGGDNNSGGYNSSSERGEIIPTIKDPVLEKIYDLSRSTLNQKELEQLEFMFQLYNKGMISQISMSMFINKGLSLMFEVNSDATEGNSARFNSTKNKISFRSQDDINNYTPLSEEMFHAIQYHVFYGEEMDMSIINYEFEAKVLSDWNVVTSDAAVDLVGYNNFELATEPSFVSFPTMYVYLIDMLTTTRKRDVIWRGNVDIIYDTLEEIWSNYQHKYRPNSSYGKKVFDSSFVPVSFQCMLTKVSQYIHCILFNRYTFA